MNSQNVSGVITRSAGQSIGGNRSVTTRSQSMANSVPRVGAGVTPRQPPNYSSQNRNPESGRQASIGFYSQLQNRRVSHTRHRYHPAIRPGLPIPEIIGFGGRISGNRENAFSPSSSNVWQDREDSVSLDLPASTNIPQDGQNAPIARLATMQIAAPRPDYSPISNPAFIRSFLERIPFFGRSQSAAFLEDFVRLSEASKGLTKKQIDDSTITYNFKPVKRTRLPRNKTAESERGNESVGLDNVDSSETCIVCFDNFLLNNKLRRLPCLHVFHYKCIDKWLQSNITCPICRVSIPIDYEKLMANLESGNTIDQWLREHEEIMQSSTVATIRLELREAAVIAHDRLVLSTENYADPLELRDRPRAPRRRRRH